MKLAYGMALLKALAKDSREGMTVSWPAASSTNL